jgi:hypothetical protein
MQNIAKTYLKTNKNGTFTNLKKDTLSRTLENRLRKIGTLLNMQQLSNYK